MAEAKHGSNVPAGLLFLDLDGFKAINDTMGHVVGDALLVEMARRLNAAVGPGNTIARLGGDEFVVLCRRGDGGGMIALAEDIRQIVEAPFDANGRHCRVTASTGIAFAHASAGLNLLRAADIAMYVASAAEETKSSCLSQPCSIGGALRPRLRRAAHFLQPRSHSACSPRCPLRNRLRRPRYAGSKDWLGRSQPE